MCFPTITSMTAVKNVYFYIKIFLLLLLYVWFCCELFFPLRKEVNKGQPDFKSWLAGNLNLAVVKLQSFTCILSYAPGSSVFSLVQQAFTNLCRWLLADERQTGVFSSQTLSHSASMQHKNLKGSQAWEVGVFFCFFLGVNFLALPPTESKHFCLPDKCAREEKAGNV